MTNSKSMQIFNTKPLMNKINSVIESGLNEILADFKQRFELLEETHRQIMRLPSVVQEIEYIKDDYVINSSDDEEEDKPIFLSIKDMTHDLIHDEMSVFEKRLNKLEENYGNIGIILDKILTNMTSFSEAMKEMKANKIDNSFISENVEKSSVVKTSENENVEIYIEETNESENYEEEIPNDESYVTSIEQNINQQKENNKLEQHNKLEEDIEYKQDVFEEPISHVNQPGEEVEEQEQEQEQEGAEEESNETETIEEGEEQESNESETIEQAEEEQEGTEESNETETIEEGEEQEGAEESNETETIEEGEEQEGAEESNESESREEGVEQPQEGAEEESIETEAREEGEDETEDEEEIFEIEIDDKIYCTNDDKNGFIWELTEDSEQGSKVGYFKDEEPFFYADEN